MTPTPKEYDRQPHDTDKSWAAFCVYRDMGLERSLEKVAEKHRQNTAKTALRYLKIWSAKHLWVKRCRAFDAEELQRQSIALQKLRAKRKLEIEKEAWDKRTEYKKKASSIRNSPMVRAIESDKGNIFMPTDKWAIRDAVLFDRYADELGIIATGGEAPKINEIEAIKVLAIAGLLPVEFLQIADRSFGELMDKLKEAFGTIKDVATDGD